MTHTIRRPLLALLALLGLPLLLAGQEAGVTAGGAYVSLGGSDYDGVDAALGLQAQLWYRPWRRVELAVLAQRSVHDLRGVGPDLTQFLVLAEARVLIPQRPGGLTPYLGARVGYASQQFTVQGYDATAGGLALGTAAGLRIPITGRLAAEVAASWTYLSFGEFSVLGTSVGGTDTRGSALALQAGVAIAVTR